ncbi:hypothetical protein D3C76_974810 [compost metagenome]
MCFWQTTGRDTHEAVLFHCGNRIRARKVRWISGAVHHPLEDLRVFDGRYQEFSQEGLRRSRRPDQQNVLFGDESQHDVLDYVFTLEDLVNDLVADLFQLVSRIECGLRQGFPVGFTLLFLLTRSHFLVVRIDLVYYVLVEIEIFL